ncbi:MAG: hypothetical protein ACRDJP_00040 [Actinomycetota bacterium]
MNAARSALPLVAAACLVGCRGEPRLGPPPQGPPAVVEPLPELAPAEDPATGIGRGIARTIERRYPLVEVWDVSVTRGGTAVAYAVRMRLEPRSAHPDLEAWQSHVSAAAGDQREAAIEMLKTTIRAMPRVRLVSVWQDEFIQPYWSRRQIRKMGEPGAYRGFDAYRSLVLSAAVLPGRPG